MPHLLHDLLFQQASSRPDGTALIDGERELSYARLAEMARGFARGLLEAGAGPGDRVGVYLEKRVEAVAAMFGASAAGTCFVPLNPLYQARHVTHILRDCDVALMVTSPARLAIIQESLPSCADLERVVVVDGATAPDAPGLEVTAWDRFLDQGRSTTRSCHRRIDEDMVAIFYTSGSTGMPKGVVLSHRNMVTGARSVCEYLENAPEDRILAALPFSFDAGFSQLTTGFLSGATVVLLNYLLPRDVINAIQQHRITGLTGVPPLFNQLVQAPWPDGAAQSLRYLASTGGTMPKATLERLRACLPGARVFLMYGLTEAFRSTYLPPEEIDRRPGSMGKAIPNAEILVIDGNGRVCGPGESGELVHRGALVSKGYWNDPQRTAARFRPLPNTSTGLCLPEVAVWSGDRVRIDVDGFLYFEGRQDDMIKTSGYRVSPSEVEDVLYESDQIAEAAAVGAPHPMLGAAIVALVRTRDGADPDVEGLLRLCRRQLPSYMVPKAICARASMPLTANGKLDRRSRRAEVCDIFAGTDAS